MDGPELVFERLATASHDVRDAAGRLRTERNAIGQAFHRVVGGDWTGVAAASFVEAFDLWNQGLTDVEEGLAAMGQLIDATRRDFEQTEAGVVDSVHVLSARLIERLS